jgi:fumarate reductase iron-sulfur subunit
MVIKVKRGEKFQEFEVSQNLTLLNALFEIKAQKDSSLTFDSGCRSMVCGSCSVILNGKETLACGVKIKDGDSVEPLRYHNIIRDLKVDKSSKLKTIKSANSYLKSYKEATIEPKDEKLLEKESDCILCDSCYSACPVMEINSSFLGPFALVRAYRYLFDKRVENSKEMVDAIQKNGVWDCTLCGECTAVCPKGIDPKGNIIQLQNLSVQYGYMNPNLATMSFGDSFGGFGF